MLSVFNAKVRLFNKALTDGADRVQISSLGFELIDIALKQVSNPNIIDSNKQQYLRQAKTVMAHLEDLSSSAPPPVASAIDGADPFYSPKEWFSDEVPNLSFADIVGGQQVKDSFIVNIVAPLKPEFQRVYRKFRGNDLGFQLLLFGPPGTGKTHMVRCLAGELKCKIAIVSASEILAGVVGVAEKNIRDVFQQASELDRCIIFIDEIDSICSDRGSEDSRHTKSVLTTLLTCMDGFTKGTKPGQLRIIIAATNLPWKLDPALKRGGRFEQQIYVSLPDLSARKKFILDSLSKMPYASDDVTVDLLASRLDGYSGADIKAILRQIADRPLKRAIVDIYKGRGADADKERITLSDCLDVINNYINPVNAEMLCRFEAYDRGISYEELKKANNSKL